MKRFQRKRLVSFNSMNDQKKQKVVDYINRNGISIRQASMDLNMTTSTINKIYEEKFGKKDREIHQSIDNLKNLINKNN
tara:strand:+ start:1178 stop:1414 length:237 start_codon:yes stop_codon:yes gene_type:complete